MSENVEGTSGSEEIRVLLSTCPPALAEELAGFLVEGRHAACVNILPGVTSIYRWKGKIERDSECLLVIKCSKSVVRDTLAAILEKHPYEVPEVVVLAVEGGNPSYLSWVVESTGQG